VLKLPPGAGAGAGVGLGVGAGATQVAAPKLVRATTHKALRRDLPFKEDFTKVSFGAFQI